MHLSDPAHAAPGNMLPPASRPAASGTRFNLLHSARVSDLLLAWADRYRRWVFASLVLLYAAGFNGQWRPEPDSALYLSIGRNIAEGKGYTYHGKSHRLAYPGLPVVFAAISKVAGQRSLLAALVLMPLLG